jgi:hypothetical protein
MMEEQEENSANPLCAADIAEKKAVCAASKNKLESESQIELANIKLPDVLSEDSDGSFSVEVKKLNAIKYFKGTRNLHRCKNCDRTYEIAWELK